MKSRVSRGATKIFSRLFLLHDPAHARDVEGDEYLDDDSFKPIDELVNTVVLEKRVYLSVI
jgi:hypothetical protein